MYTSESTKPVQDCGNYEVWFDDGRPSKFFYFDDLPNRRLRPDTMTKTQAAERLKRSLAPRDALARRHAPPDKLPYMPRRKSCPMVRLARARSNAMDFRFSWMTALFIDG